MNETETPVVTTENPSRRNPQTRNPLDIHTRLLKWTYRTLIANHGHTIRSAKNEALRLLPWVPAHLFDLRNITDPREQKKVLADLFGCTERAKTKALRENWGHRDREIRAVLFLAEALISRNEAASLEVVEELRNKTE